MSVYLYPGGFRLIHKSGVGQALLHQRKALTAVGVPLARTMGEGDVVHINTVFPDSFLAALVARLSGKRVVYYAHSTMEDFRRSFPGSNWFAPLFKQWIKWCYQMGDVIITPTDYSRNLLLGYSVQKPIYSLTNGVDCSGFTQQVFANYGISLPHSSKAQAGYGTAVDVQEAQPGDLIFYADNGSIYHVVIYIGNGQAVHASSAKTGIKISDVQYDKASCAVSLL